MVWGYLNRVRAAGGGILTGGVGEGWSVRPTIIVDAPPILGLADAPILANIAGGTLLVVEAGSTRVGAAHSAIKRLLGARARLLGALLTKFDAKAAGYGGYGYGGYGYSSYQYYGYGTAPSSKRLEKR